MTSTYLYWITRLDNLLGFIQFFNIACLVASIFGIFAWFICYIVKESNKKYNGENHIDPDWLEADRFQKMIKIPHILVIITFFLTMITEIFIPTTKEMVAIDIVPKICSNEQLKDISKDVIEIAQSWLKEMKENAKKTN